MRLPARCPKAAAHCAGIRPIHPGGKDRRDAEIRRDLLHTGGHIPVKPRAPKMSTRLVEMSSKDSAGVYRRRSRARSPGIITDGDLRRHIAAPT